MNRRKVLAIKHLGDKSELQKPARQGKRLPVVFTRDKIASILNERYTEADCSDLIWLRFTVDKKPSLVQGNGYPRNDSKSREREKHVEKTKDWTVRKNGLRGKLPFSRRSD
jgi:hypothetical protein